MIKPIAFYLIFGKPLIMYGGISALLLILITATLGVMILKGKKIPLSAHVWLARITVLVAIFHAILGLSLSFNF
ncbi:MAG: hypothetical protein WCW26_00705 [Candidatus Buchananbacteria bacterium]